MSYGIRYNRTTNHITGLAKIAASSWNTCGAVTRGNLAVSGATATELAEILDVARKLGGRKLCGRCEAAVMGAIADAEAATETVELAQGVTVNAATRVLSGPVKALTLMLAAETAIWNDNGDLILR